MIYLIIFPLFFSILFLPLLFAYYNFLPSQAGWLRDLSILFAAGVLALAVPYKELRKDRYFRIFSRLTLLSILVYISSGILNNSEAFLVFTRVRYLIYPFLLFFIFKAIVFQYPSWIPQIDKWLKYILILQIILTPLQYLIHDFLPFVKSFYYEPYAHVDVATGTFGRGNGSLGVLLVMYFVYALVVKKEKWTWLYLTPLLVLFSGGSNVILVVTLALLQIFASNRFSFFRVKASSIMAGVVIGILVVVYSAIFFEEDLITMAYNQAQQTYYFYFMQNDGEGVGGLNKSMKVTRLAGYAFLQEYFTEPFHWFVGLGPDAFAKSQSFDVVSNALGVERIKGGFLVKFLESGNVGLFIFYALNLLVLAKLFFRRRLSNWQKFMFIAFFIYVFSTFYAKTFANLPLMLYFTFWLAYTQTDEEIWRKKILPDINQTKPKS